MTALLPVKVMAAQPVAVALFDRHQDVDALAVVAGTEGKPVQAAFVANLRLGFLDGGVGIALVAIGLADALGVFLQLGGVEGFREEILKDDRIRNADGLQVLHRAAQIKSAQVLVAGEIDLADFYRRAFLDVEVHLHRGGRNGLDIGLDGGELMAMLRQHCAQTRSRLA